MVIWIDDDQMSENLAGWLDGWMVGWLDGRMVELLDK